MDELVRKPAHVPGIPLRRHSKMRTRVVWNKNLRIAGIVGMFSLSVFVLFGSGVSAATIRVGPTRTYTTPAAAAAVANSGDIIEIDAGTYNTTGCVVTWADNNLTIRGVGGMARLDASGISISNGKAIWVIQGNNTTVENIEFMGAQVAEQNGAGIRQEGSNLTVTHCYFHHNENGILSSDQTNSEILIEYSEFAYNGYGDGYTHNLYINHIGKLTFRYNYSHHALIGHLLKSRAAENYIMYNRLSDEATGTASYEIDLPNGGRSYIIGNLLHQGIQTGNSILLSYAAEGATNPFQELYVSGNTFVNDRSNGTAIRLSNTPTVKIVNNLFDNFATTIQGTYTGTVTNNLAGTNLGFVNRANYDYHLTASSPARNVGTAPGSAQGMSLTPVFEYVHPADSTSRTSVGVIDVGAYEYGNASVSYLLWTR
jgi:hypothetical protein